MNSSTCLATENAAVSSCPDAFLGDAFRPSRAGARVLPLKVSENPEWMLPASMIYWDHVDWVLDQAAERGMYLGMVACWGAVVERGRRQFRKVRPARLFEWDELACYVH